MTPAQGTRSPESDRDLLKRYHIGGDTSAREELVQRHLPLVRSLARRYAGRGEALEDIEQVGAIGRGFIVGEAMSADGELIDRFTIP